MSKYALAVALWGEAWTNGLWSQIRDLSIDDLVDVSPRFQVVLRGDGMAEARDMRAGARADLLSWLANRADIAQCVWPGREPAGRQ